MSLVETKSRKPVPCQLSNTPKGTDVAWIVPRLKAGETQKLKATVKGDHEDRPKVVLDDRSDAGRVDVTVHGRPFTTYHYGHQWVRPFLHPIMGPHGAPVTRNWPVASGSRSETKRHPHHKGVWVAHGACGKVDNWSEEKGHGYQRHQSIAEQVSGPVFGKLVAKNAWCSAADRVQFEETRGITFYALGRGVGMLDMSIRFRMGSKAVTFHDTKEGGLLSVRVASSMEVQRGGCIENAYGGINQEEAWGRRAPWCDYSGAVQGRPVGIAAMDHVSNPRFPTGWHVRDYGLMTANCFGWNDFDPGQKVRGDMTFAKNSVTTWRYRLFVHKGNARQGRVAERFIDFVYPPRVTVDT